MAHRPRSTMQRMMSSNDLLVLRTAKRSLAWSAIEARADKFGQNHTWLQSNATRMERVQADLLAQCAFWKSVKPELGQ
ncbi:uncharacterized protein MYCFIDRAFT_182310 [Pseudocercospora fijiensis CIRAD86]|uniref:Uncharacterized protein n=1 Tax=Pseudocercospora fijiensis (strain CIRAD86) TaxID=383855 RepID=M3B4J4_PSEFD|nr:uncharacterized protein MYCFIDRAFT_182310 [Pseudocercospora fijiensis CIRAD86]EME84293.1 hypothetical protein MYCFIDRAFT_182310 [Pseudocercospora fijiensis CIRAD86]